MASTSRLTVGLIADIQYADIPAASSFDGSEKRDYRRSLQHTQVAVESFLSRGVSHVVNLGDIIDGKSNPNASPSKECKEVHANSKKALQEVMEVLERKGSYTLLHVDGNHERYCFGSDFLPYLPLPPGVHLPDPTLMYYSYSPVPGVLFVVLDGYDVCLLRPEGSAEREEAQRLLKAHNPHNPAAWGEGRGDFFQRVVGPAQRWCPFNGALGEGQLAWLRATLEGAREVGGGGAKSSCSPTSWPLRGLWQPALAFSPTPACSGTTPRWWPCWVPFGMWSRACSLGTSTRGPLALMRRASTTSPYPARSPMSRAATAFSQCMTTGWSWMGVALPWRAGSCLLCVSKGGKGVLGAHNKQLGF